jgi:hypothetical protein
VAEAQLASVVVAFIRVELVQTPMGPLGAPDHSSLHGVPSGTIPVGLTLVTFRHTLGLGLQV